MLLSGGVAANKGLRDTLQAAVTSGLPDVELLIPPLSLCGDNAAMIGAAAYAQYKADSHAVADMSLNAKPGLML